jgi:putative isomerase
LQRYLDRWFAYDKDGNGLPVWNSSDASGMDNQISRSGDLESYTDEGVDLACYLYRELQAMAVIAKGLGKVDDEKKYIRHASQLAKAINKVFWDGKDGFYYDRNEKPGKRIKIKSIAGFIPLWAGVASRAQASRLVNEHLLNPNEFWMKYPIATYDQSCGVKPRIDGKETQETTLRAMP